MKKFVTAAAAALTIGASLALTAAPAEAKFGRKGALFGGIAAGLVGAAIIGSAAHAHGGYYTEPDVGNCWRERRPVYNSWGEFRGYRSIRVCN